MQCLPGCSVAIGFPAVAPVLRAVCALPPRTALRPCCVSPGKRGKYGLSASLQRNGGEKAGLELRQGLLQRLFWICGHHNDSKAGQPESSTSTAAQKETRLCQAHCRLPVSLFVECFLHPQVVLRQQFSDFKLQVE